MINLNLETNKSYKPKDGFVLHITSRIFRIFASVELLGIFRNHDGDSTRKGNLITT